MSSRRRPSKLGMSRATPTARASPPSTESIAIATSIRIAAAWSSPRSMARSAKAPTSAPLAVKRWTPQATQSLTRSDTAARDYQSRYIGWAARAPRIAAGEEGCMPAPDRQARAEADSRRALEFLRQGGDSFLTTKVDTVLNWGRKYSMFLYPFVTACCGMEFMSVAGPRYDLDRFGCALPRFSPRQSDLLMVVGTITHRQAPVLKKVYDQMAEPKWVIAFGACTCSGGPYNNYAVVQGIDTIIPVDVFIPGCPPRPEAVLDGLMKLQARVQLERVPADGRHKETHELELPVVEKPVA